MFSGRVLPPTGVLVCAWELIVANKKKKKTMTRVRLGGVEYPRKVTSYLSIYSLFARAILICATCGSRCLRIKNTGVKSASGSLGLIT